MENNINHTFLSFILKNIVFQAFVLLSLFIAAYWIPLRGIYNVWMTEGDYSYGILIPFISIYFFLTMKEKLKEITLRTSWSALPVLFVFLLLSIYGILGSSGNISRPVIPILILLFAGFCFGLEFVKKFSLPLLFLFFMIPLPASLDRTIGVFLKSVSSKLGGLIIRATGIPVNVSGNVIDLGVMQLQVVDACSGLRYVFPLFAIGIFFAYFFEKIRWKQIFYVFSTLPIAIVLNSIRVGLTGILSVVWDPKIAEGIFHDFSGWVIFMAAVSILFIERKIINLFFPSNNLDNSDSKPVITPSFPAESHYLKISNRNTNSFMVSIVLLLMVMLLGWNTKAMPPVKINGGIECFPLAFKGWKGVSYPIDKEIIEKSGAEEAFNGVYQNAKGDVILLYLGYRESAFLENENFFHSPTVCLPSAGWTVQDKTRKTITGAPFFKTIPVTEMIVENMGQRQMVYFWFQTKNKVTHDKNINRLHLSLHALSHENTHDLFIRVMTKIDESESITSAEKRIKIFSRDMMATLLDFLKKNQK